MKRLLYCLLAFAFLVVSLVPSPVLASGSEVQPPEDLQNRVKSAIEQAAATGQEGRHHIDGMSINMDIDYLVEDQNHQVHWLESSPQTQSYLGQVTIAYGLLFVPPERTSSGTYPGDAYFVNYVYIVSSSGAPTRVHVINDIYTDDYRTGQFTTNNSHLEVDWNMFQIYPGQAATKYHLVTQTKFYKDSFFGEVEYLYGLDTDTETETKGPFLANKKAFEYPCRYYDPKDTRVPPPCVDPNTLEAPILYKDPFSDKVMFMPDTTLMQQVPVEQRVPWNNDLRGQFIAQYIERYGDPKQKDPNFDWADYDIHHIIPREYGGTNDFDNLIPLRREFHQQNVTPWWTNY